MAVAAADLLAPKGDLTLDLFPGESTEALTTRLDGYLTEAAAKVSLFPAELQDEAAIAWGYARAYRAIHVRMSGSPASVDVKDELSRQFLITQIQNFRDLAEQWEATFASVKVAAKDAATKAAPPVGGTTPLVPLW